MKFFYLGNNRDKNQTIKVFFLVLGFYLISYIASSFLGEDSNLRIALTVAPAIATLFYGYLIIKKENYSALRIIFLFLIWSEILKIILKLFKQ